MSVFIGMDWTSANRPQQILVSTGAALWHISLISFLIMNLCVCMGVGQGSLIGFVKGLVPLLVSESPSAKFWWLCLGRLGIVYELSCSSCKARCYPPTYISFTLVYLSSQSHCNGFSLSAIIILKCLAFVIFFLDPVIESWKMLYVHW